MALIDAIEKLSNALDNKKCTIGIFIDLEKSLWHYQSRKKQERYGIRGRGGWKG